jgi:hypothetical protein
MWVKLSEMPPNMSLFMAGTGASNTFMRCTFSQTSATSSELNWRQVTSVGGLAAEKGTSQVFRDPSSWYHFVFVWNTTVATASDRQQIYVNGNRVTAFGANTEPSQNTVSYFNTSSYVHYLGALNLSGLSTYFDGYMTEINFIDGQALTPSSFGMTNPQTGQWIPLKYSGTYGTNGFYLNFKDATSTTTLGYDYSGNANNWTTNNFSVTAGSGNDSLTDVPTPWIVYNTTGDVGGVVRGNYATLNAIDRTTGAAFVLSNGNLTGTTTNNAAAWLGIRSTFACPSGKWYWEVVSSNATTSTSTYQAYIIGLATQNTNLNSNPVAASNGTYGYVNYSGIKFVDNTTASYGASFAANDVVGVAFDVTAGTLEFYKNGVSQGVAYTGITGNYFPMLFQYSNTAASVDTSFNFGQRPFAYTPPSGYLSLCTTNLPASTVLKGGDYFNPVLYTGNDTARSITGVGFQPDWVWLKSRSNATVHRIFDSVRGATRTVSSNLTDAEAVESQQLTSFNSDGFSLGTDTGANGSGRTFVTWNWKAGGTAVTNTAGSITSSVSANTTSGFSIVTYTGTGSNGATVGHGLGVTPAMMIFKRRNSTGQWATYHSSIGNTGALRLNATSATITDVSFWNNTSPTSTVFTIGVDGDVNTNTGTYVAYCFAAVPGYSAFGSYTGNGSTDGPFVYMGFRPEYVMVKRTDSSGNDWEIRDAARNPYNSDTSARLWANSSASELNDFPADLLSNGFKPRSTGTNSNGSGATYIYIAFAESPFQFANAR